MNLTERKARELAQKIASIENEFKHWRQQSTANQPFEKHHSQILRISTQLDGTRQRIEAALAQAQTLQALAAGGSPAGQLLSRCRELERMTLEVHRLWEFFRAKFIQREHERFRDYLELADEFSWACYQPARQQLGPAEKDLLKEPPLVFFNGASSPFVQSRNSRYQAEQVPGELLKTATLLQELKALPFSVVGIPWFQAEHLPDVLVVAHEVGHVVETDLGLTAALQKLLSDALSSAAVTKNRREAWSSWLGEVFADLYGIAAAGPAFVGALLDFIAHDPTRVQEETRSPPWGDYPTDQLRALVCIEALNHLGFSRWARRYSDEWKALYPQNAMPAFTADAALVARALLDGPYPRFGGSSLHRLLGFGANEQAAAETDAGNLLREKTPGTGNIRVLLAAARIAFEEQPDKYKEAGVAQRVVETFKQNREVGPRSSPTGKGTAEAMTLEDLDKAAADALFKTLEGHIDRDE